jgi:hypothetical protein
LRESLVAEREALYDPINVGFVHDCHLSEATPAFGVLGGEQVASAGVRAQDLAASGDFEPLGHGLFGFDAFGAAHKSTFVQKERAI